MSVGLENYNGGTTDEYGTLLVVDRQMGSGVIEGLMVAANASPNMTVYVQPGTVAIPAGTYPSSYNYRAHIDTASPGAAVTVGTAAASPRIDYIVAYVDKTVAGSTAGANVNNTNAVVKLADVQGTPAGSPSVPTVAQIQSTIGAANPYIILAQIAVGASVSTITNPNITDLRTFAADRNDAALGQQSYVDNGLVWTATSGLAATMSAGKAYINVGGVMVPASAAAVASFTFTASNDTYISINVNGTLTYTNVANNAASPTLPANSLWLAVVVTSGTAVTGITGGARGATFPVVSSFTVVAHTTQGDPIYPVAMNKTALYQQRTANTTQGATVSEAGYNGFGATYTFRTISGARYRLRLWEPRVYGTTGSGNNNAIFAVYVGGTRIGQISKAFTNSGIADFVDGGLNFFASTTGTTTLQVKFYNPSASTITGWEFDSDSGTNYGPAQLTVVMDS